MTKLYFSSLFIFSPFFLLKWSKLIYLLQQVKSVQKAGPYILCGYSFGASVAFEMALLLEKANEKVKLIFLDGSPTYVASHTGSYKARQKPDNKNADADALTYFISLFKEDIDYVKVRTVSFHNKYVINTSITL